ncbi:MAG: TrmJ/YjtD family RNA methyltransferase [Blastocatellia bacterium]|nr:TrmJ/YjtD family RNA methyltransferase [Blastocatellia bacterium]
MKACRIVLVRPRDPNNIGAAARAMKNFGFLDLAVVSPHPPVWQEAVSAVNAEDVLANARVVGTLAEAVADCTLVVGTADRRRVEPKRSIYTPADLSRELRVADQRMALVFGQEKHGLTNDDLSHCHRIMSIPTQSGCPSMNLGQAVAVCCYELRRETSPRTASTAAVEAVSLGTVETAVRLSLDVLQRIDFTPPGNEEHWTRRLRSNFLRYRLSEDDLGILCNILRKIKNGLER